MDIRNVAIIAHVDHGKTTLVNQLLKSSGAFRENEEVLEMLDESAEETKSEQPQAEDVKADMELGEEGEKANKVIDEPEEPKENKTKKKEKDPLEEIEDICKQFFSSVDNSSKAADNKAAKKTVGFEPESKIDIVM